jgi:hypothetical protein
MGAQLLASGIGSTTGYGWILDPFTALDDFESPTVIRMLVSLAARTSNVVTATGLFIGFGIYIHTADEDEPSALPTLGWDPLADPQSDWLMRWVRPLPAGGNVQDLVNNTAQEKEFDIRAKRKIPRGAGILAAFQSYDVNGTQGSTVGIAADVRCLIISG